MFPVDNDFEVDSDAPIIVPLRRRLDGKQNSFYIGRLQFPGTFNWEWGACFKAYLDDPDHEELHILPLDPKRKLRPPRNGTKVLHDRIQVDMHPDLDEVTQEKIYTGEIKGPVFSYGLPGLFFTLFVSQENREELQISKLRARKMTPRVQEEDLSNPDNPIPIQSE